MRAILLLVVLTAALAVPALAATPAQWARQANAICTQMTREQNAIKQPRNAAQLLAGLLKTHAIIARAAARIDALPAPKARAATIEQLLAAIRRGNATLARAITSLRAGRVTAAQALLRQATTQFGTANRLSTRLGATVCAK